MTRALFLWVCLITTISASSQNLHKIDSLKRNLSPAETKDRFSALCSIAWEYRFAYPDSTIAYGERAYSLGKKLNLPADLAHPLNFLGVAYIYKGEKLKAYDLFVQALEISGQQHDTLQIAHSNNNLGRLFFEQGILAKAYDYFIKAHDLFKKKNDSYGLAYTLQSMGNLQRTQKDFAQAEKNYQEAYAIRLNQGNSRDIMSALMILSRLYYEQNKYDRCISLLHKADSVGKLIGDEVSLAETKILLAKSYLAQGKLDAASQIAQAGATVITHLKYKRILPETILILGEIKLQQGNLAQAEMYFKQSLETAKETNNLHDQMNAYHKLWKLAEQQNNQQKVVLFMNKYLLLNDSIKDLELTRQIERLKFQFDIEKKDRENESLKLSQALQETVIARQRSENIALLISLGGTAAIAFLLWYYFRKRNITNQKLAAQNQFIELQRKQIEKRNTDLTHQNHRLEELNHEKDMLMNIVAHDLKSPLARILGLANLIKMEKNLSTSQQEYLQLMTDVTQSNLDLITDLLDVNALHEESKIPHPVEFDLGSLLGERIVYFQYSSTHKKIDLSYTHNLENQIRSNPGYFVRIIDNLVSNSIKFSKPGSSVTVSGTLTDDIFSLSVKDNGPGFSDEDKRMLYQRFKKLSARPTAGESSNGLGLAIVKTLVDRLHGEIALISEPGKGSEFIVRIPVKVVEPVSV